MSWRTPENLSADGIATTLGFADAATMVAAINAGGTSILSGTAVPTTEGVDGDFYLRTTNTQFYGPKTAGAWGAGVSLIGATGATGDAGATGATGPAGPAPSGTGLVQVAAGVASTLGLGTALHGVRVNAAGTAYETAEISATDSTKLPLAGGTMTGALGFDTIADPGSTFRGIHTGNLAGWVYLQAPAGAGAVALVVGTARALDVYSSYIQANVPIVNTVNNQFLGTGTSAGASVANIWRDSDGSINYNSSRAHIHYSGLATRTASTAIVLCPVPTGDTAKVEISETTIDDCLAFVNAAGSVALYDRIGGTVNANIVNSSSPAAGEYGVYISAGVLYFKGGSSYAGKMASFSKIGKA